MVERKKDLKNSRKEEKKNEQYDKLTQSLIKKGGLVSAMLSASPVEAVEELKKERIEERKTERKVEKVKKNYYISKDAAILLDVMSIFEEKNKGQIVEEAIFQRFKDVFPTYSDLDKEVFKSKYLPKLSEELRRNLDIL